jgi:hypothetical protein
VLQARQELELHCHDHPLPEMHTEVSMPTIIIWLIHCRRLFEQQLHVGCALSGCNPHFLDNEWNAAVRGLLQRPRLVLL